MSLLPRWQVSSNDQSHCLKKNWTIRKIPRLMVYMVVRNGPSIVFEGSTMLEPKNPRFLRCQISQPTRQYGTQQRLSIMQLRSIPLLPENGTKYLFRFGQCSLRDSKTYSRILHSETTTGGTYLSPSHTFWIHTFEQ